MTPGTDPQLTALTDQCDYYRAQRDRWKNANAHCERALNSLGEELTRMREERDQLVVERDEYGDEMRLLQRRVIFLEGQLARARRAKA